MSITVQTIHTSVDTYLNDTTTDSISLNERYEAITEATLWLMENTISDNQLKTFNLDYIGSIHNYKISNSLADFLEPSDLRRAEVDQDYAALRKSPGELAEDIGNNSTEFAFAIERKNSAAYVKINLTGKYNPWTVASFDSLTADGGTWVADTSTSDASNVQIDQLNQTQGSGCLTYDIVAAQSGNNRATISSTIGTMDFTQHLNVSTLTLDVYNPDVTYTSSYTLYWGTDSSNYWSATVTSDAQGDSFASGAMTLAFKWSNATKVGSPTVSSIKYIRIDENYSAGQPNSAGHRLDNLLICHPERLVFYYLSTKVGTTSGGTDIYAFTSDTDIPFFSSQYDFYRYPVAHKAASILFRKVGLLDDSAREEQEAMNGLPAKKKLFPSHLHRENKSFKAGNISFNKRKFF